MTGRRRARGNPYHAKAAAARRRVRYVERRGRARTPGQRVSAATSYLTGALAQLPEATASALATIAVAQLEDLTRRAEAEHARNRKGRSP